MQKNKITPIIPGPGRQAASIRAPGACHLADIIEAGKNRFQPDLCVAGKLNYRFYVEIIAFNMKIDATVSLLPRRSRTPGR